MGNKNYENKPNRGFRENVNPVDETAEPVEPVVTEETVETEESVKDIRPDGFYDEVTREQRDMFGLKCELVHSMDKNYCFDYYYFSNGKYTYYINVKYTKNADEADIKEMLDGITIKNK